MDMSVNEKYENIEIMRAIDNGYNVSGFELKDYFYSVDVKRDLSKANRDMKNNKIFTKYNISN
jgi:CMP-2-keto-3-deoxyoctulosonic acid synthetase